MSDPDVYRRLDALERLVRRLGTIMERPAPATTYTPTYFGGTSAGVTTYTAQVGYSMLIGTMAIVWGTVAWSAATGTGNARVGLPFTVQNVANYAAPAILRLNAVTYAGDSFQGIAALNTNYLEIEGVSSNAAPTKTAVEAAGSLIFQVIYLIA